MDNLAANKTPAIRRWARRENVELCFTPTNASWANPIEAQFGPVRTFVMSNSDYRNHPALARRLQDYLRGANAHARHPDVLAAQRRERARIRSDASNAGAARNLKPHDRPGETFMASALGVPVLAGKLADELSDHGRHPQRQQVVGTRRGDSARSGDPGGDVRGAARTIGYS